MPCWKSAASLTLLARPAARPPTAVAATPAATFNPTPSMDCNDPSPLDSSDPDLPSRSVMALPTVPKVSDAWSTPLIIICRLLATLFLHSGFYIQHVQDAVYVYNILLAQLARQTVKLSAKLQLYVLWWNRPAGPKMRIELRS